jgi:carbon-monoxide dehydrogenase medium subunit
MAIGDFITGVFEVALAPGEILEAVRIPRLSARARFGYYKICRKTGELAQAIGAVLHDPERAVFRAVVGATGSRPIVIADASTLFESSGSGHRGAFAAGALTQRLVAAGMTDRFDCQIHVAALRRALGQAEIA